MLVLVLLFGAYMWGLWLFYRGRPHAWGVGQSVAFWALGAFLSFDNAYMTGGLLMAMLGDCPNPWGMVLGVIIPGAAAIALQRMLRDERPRGPWAAIVTYAVLAAALFVAGTLIFGGT